MTSKGSAGLALGMCGLCGLCGLGTQRTRRAEDEEIACYRPSPTLLKDVEKGLEKKDMKLIYIYIGLKKGREKE